ncbi:MAG: hypothetical protein RSA22_07695 [Acinetobacter sp.]
MDIQEDKDFTSLPEIAKLYQACKERDLTIAEREYLKGARDAWQAAKAQAVPAQLDVNSILHDIDCYFDNGLSNTERTANNLLQSIYEKLSGEVKAQEPAND